MKEYLTALRDVLENGNERDDRTGTGTISKFGVQMRFDLSQGFPLVTTKKVFLKGVIRELLFFIKGDCTIDYLLRNNIHIWDKDCKKWDEDESNYIGKSYGVQWRRWGCSKLISTPDSTPFHIHLNDIVDDKGEVRHSKRYGDFKIIGHNTVQFLKTGYIGKYRKDHIESGGIKDPYYPSIRGFCCIGNIDMDDVKREYYAIWKAIVDRCYNKDNEHYSYYGQRGIRLCNRWKCFEFFYEDIQKLDNYALKEAAPSEYQLDKDIKGNGFIYSMRNCIWARVEDNAKKSKEKCIYTVSDGEDVVSFKNASDFMRRYNVKNQWNFCSMLRGERLKCEGWALGEVKDCLKNGIDQLRNVIDEIKANPTSRRLIVSAWNVSELDEMALPPCHVLFQLYVNDGKLSCQMYQRSGDMFLGVPFNIASYALLTMMIAQECGLGLGEFIHCIGDAHIYKNHIEQVKEQLSREPRPLPRMILNPAITNVDDFDYEDFTLEGYDPWPAIKGEQSC